MVLLTKSDIIRKQIHKKSDQRSKQKKKVDGNNKYKYNKYEKIQQYKTNHSPHNTNQYLLSKFIEQPSTSLSAPESILDILLFSMP
ncbi:unnamed protein product [Paramecium primaurelia]|uniref:Uncharacterized protein n=2 Tax=Paramecium TaxID=5884 RepID=A0A8S1U704_9CILI|nr:unnamed protein product [Paramecium primaurelia]CAD8159527.1 unnamed protein product [Paramecium pentaurelia]